ncbi:MAG: magnesium transporter [Campylobacteraceae bacterium]|nr:magnesium transporter [Campylobacteraceae bacterium]
MEELDGVKGLVKKLDDHISKEIEEELSADDIADILKELKEENGELYLEYLHKLDVESISTAAIEMPEHMLEDMLNEFSKDKLVNVLEELESDDQLELLEYLHEIDEDKTKIIFDELDEEDKQDILKLSSYDEDMAGSYMQVEVLRGYLDETVMEAVDRLRDLRHRDEIETVYQLFIVDENDVLKYAIPLYDLIIYNFSLTIEEVIKSAPEDAFKPKFARDHDDIAEVARKFQEFDLSVLPVVDSRGVLVGRITTDDIHDFIQEQATEQIYSMVGVDDEVEEEDYSILRAGKSRAVWLLFNLFTAFLSSAIIGLFDATIEAYVALAVLMPIVASMGGNTGSQALTVTVRRLALGDIEFSDAKRVIKREVGIALINGTIFAILVGVVAWAWFKAPLLGVVIAMAMLINLSCAGLFGAIIPLTLKKFNIDPAVGSSVLLTAATDIIGFFSFLGLATWIIL